MATYTELAGIKSGAEWNALQSKIKVAVVEKATAIIDSTSPAATALEWAKATIGNPSAASTALENYVIAANSSAAISAIYGASDAAIQTNVDVAVDAIYG
ncbi:MAG: hypothetical protein GY746_17280 [Gammaproteobacteria bacterium]|nr:hypothetical protein [Gammaproteobacteria bacterium]